MFYKYKISFNKYKYFYKYEIIFYKSKNRIYIQRIPRKPYFLGISEDHKFVGNSSEYSEKDVVGIFRGINFLGIFSKLKKKL